MSKLCKCGKEIRNERYDICYDCYMQKKKDLPKKDKVEPKKERTFSEWLREKSTISNYVLFVIFVLGVLFGAWLW